MNLYIITLVFALAFVTSADLSVYNLQALGVKDSNLTNISYSMANFGFVPFGKTMIGQLIHAPGYSDECQYNSSEVIQTNSTNFFMLIPRGNCKFVIKAINAQKAGAKLVIIMDNQTHDKNFIMADNGEGYKVKIPAIFINYQDGERLVKVINQAKLKSSQVTVKVVFDNKKTQKVDIKFFLQANNRFTYKFINQFQDYYQKINSYVNLKLIYATQMCTFCVPEDCFFNNTYCSYHYKHSQSANGQDILSQQIRQMIVYKNYPEKWWGYMSYIGKECTKISQLQACGQTGMKKLGIDSAKIESIYKASFQKNGNNTFLAESSQNLAMSGMMSYPAISLNNYNIKGSLSAQFIFDDICNTLTSPPEACSKYISQTMVEVYVTQYWGLIFFIILLGFIVFSILFCLYKRYMKKKMSLQMQGRVDDMVSKYIQFYSQRRGNQ